MCSRNTSSLYEASDEEEKNKGLCHTLYMNLKPLLYISGETPVHNIDARVKLVLLLIYSITLFCVHTWTGIGVMAALCLACCVLGRMPFGRLLKMIAPLYIIAGIALVFNTFTLDVSLVSSSYGLGDVSAGLFAGMEPVALIGSFGFVPEGFARGCYFALRIILLILASMVVTLTTLSHDLTAALSSFLSPLQKLKLPTADIAMIVSLALRFIPLTVDEFLRVYSAQWARGAALSDGSVGARLKAWQTIFIPLFVALFRRADRIAFAMESRCYGLRAARSQLNEQAITPASWIVLLLGMSLCAGLIFFF